MTHKIHEHLRTSAIYVTVLGAGGNGSMILPHLARIHKSLLALGRAEGLNVTVYDDDLVTESNLGRQAYSPADLGLSKAVIAVQRINMFFGLDWGARVKRYDGTELIAAELVISCVDNLSTRRVLAQRGWTHSYWMDLGNRDTSGQVVLGGCGLPTIFDLHPELKDAEEDADTPSCSVAEALARQDLFINSTLANLAGQLLWTLLRKGEIAHHGYYVNLAAGRVAPIPVPDAAPQTDPARQASPAARVPTRPNLGVRRRRARAGKGAVLR